MLCCSNAPISHVDMAVVSVCLGIRQQVISTVRCLSVDSTVYDEEHYPSTVHLGIYGLFARAPGDSIGQVGFRISFFFVFVFEKLPEK
jgi:hypothetical protein